MAYFDLICSWREYMSIHEVEDDQHLTDYLSVFENSKHKKQCLCKCHVKTEQCTDTEAGPITTQTVTKKRKLVTEGGKSKRTESNA